MNVLTRKLNDSVVFHLLIKNFEGAHIYLIKFFFNLRFKPTMKITSTKSCFISRFFYYF